jgi:hypothetical protein
MSSTSLGYDGPATPSPWLRRLGVPGVRTENGRTGPAGRSDSPRNHFFVRILEHKPCVRTSALGNSDDAEHRPNSVCVVLTHHLGRPNLSEVLNCLKVILCEPAWNLRVCAPSSGQFNKCDQSKSPPAVPSSSAIDSHDVRYSSVRSLSNITLVMKPLPKFVPRFFCVDVGFKFVQGGSRVECTAITTLEFCPAFVRRQIRRLREVVVN